MRNGLHRSTFGGSVYIVSGSAPEIKIDCGVCIIFFRPLLRMRDHTSVRSLLLFADELDYLSSKINATTDKNKKRELQVEYLLSCDKLIEMSSFVKHSTITQINRIKSELNAQLHDEATPVSKD